MSRGNESSDSRIFFFGGGGGGGGGARAEGGEGGLLIQQVQHSLGSIFQSCKLFGVFWFHSDPPPSCKSILPPSPLEVLN